MIVYHGNYTEIDEVDLSFCQKERDFGRGFYVTNIRSQAEQWAARKGRWHKVQGVVTAFEVNEDVFRMLKLSVLRFEGYTEDWLDFIILNRGNKSEQQAHSHDVVEGPVADDEVAARIDDYLVGAVSREQFLAELKYKLPTHQICFCTVRSLQALVSQRAKIDVKIAHIDYDVVKALMLDYQKTEVKALDIYYTSKTYSLLADEATELYKKTWQEVYELLKQELNNKG